MKEWKLISEFTPLSMGFRRVIPRQYKLPNGTHGEWHIKDEGQSSAVVAFTALREVVLVEQFRPGPNETLLELPGGNLDATEDPLEAAKRELLEETGYAGKVEYVGRSFDCAYSNRIKHCFVATDCRKIAEPDPGEYESVSVVLMPLPEFREHLRSGSLTDGQIGYRALDHLKLL